jgi:hypothetical protein
MDCPPVQVPSQRAFITLFNPVSAPHKTKRFWIFVALGIIPGLCGPLVQRLMGIPLFALRVHISAGLITFALWVTAFWFGLRFGPVAWIVIGVIMLTFVIFAGLYS